MSRRLLLPLAILLLLAARTVAQTSVTLAPASITVIELLQPGRTYRLPQVSFVNNGAADLNLELACDSTTPGVVLHFRPQRFIFRPGDSQQVSITLQLAPTLPSGDYKTHIQAQSKAASDIALQLAAPVRFTVDKGDGFKGARFLPWLALLFLLLFALSFSRAKKCRSRL